MPEFQPNLVLVQEQPNIGITERKIYNSYTFTVSKLFNHLILVFAFLQISSNLYAGNDEPIKGLRSSFKRIQSTIKFNTLGKQLAYKRILAFEGKDSAEAYVKTNQLLDDYLPLTGGVLTGALTTPSLTVSDGYVNGTAIGINGNSLDISSGNLNSMTAGGFYRGSNMTNAPDAGWWFVQVEGHDNLGGSVSGWTKQTATAYGAGNSFAAGTTFTRNQTGGTTWTAWSRVLVSNGNIRLGSGTPNSTLDMGGSSTQPDYHYPLLWYNDNSTSVWHGTKGGIFLDQFGLANNTTLLFSTASANPGTFMVASKNTTISDASSLTPRLVVNGESGNVGIGTTTPQTRLDVKGPSASAASTLQITGNGVSSLLLGQDSDGGVIRGQGGYNALKFLIGGLSDQAANAGGVEVLRINSSGYVGIGTTSPQSTLDVKGVTSPLAVNYYSSTFAQTVQAASNNTATGILFSTKGNTGQPAFASIHAMPTNDYRASLVATYSSDMYGTSAFVVNQFNPIINQTYERLRINEYGNVIIGTPASISNAYQLNVGGIVRANKIVVNTTGADFVFDSTYKLPSLETVADFIKANKHLPQIASAEEMQKNGLDVGEQQTKLLQKIEELTLYMIELKKSNDELKRLVKKQDEKIETLNKKINN